MVVIGVVTLLMGAASVPHELGRAASPVKRQGPVVPCDFGSGTQLAPEGAGCLADAQPYTGAP